MSEYFQWKRGANLQLSPHFNSSEFECSCRQCTDQKIAVALVEKLELVREEYGAPLQITSAYRCLQRQKELLNDPKIQTVKNSQHTIGNAVDVRPVVRSLTSANMGRLLFILRKQFRAIGLAATFYHVDLRADKEREWKY
jgi:hypothetical protein